MSKKCSVELLSFSGPLFKPSFVARVSDAAGVRQLLVSWSMCGNMTRSRSFHVPQDGTSSLPGVPDTCVSINTDD